MKILFVCKGNMERSMAAEALFNKISRNNTAKSAGIDVLGEGGVGKGPSETTSILLHERGINVSGHRRAQMTKEMFDNSDIVILLMSLKEEKYLPDYLKGSKKVRFWELEGNDHTPKAHLERLRKIEEKVKALAKEIG